MPTGSVRCAGHSNTLCQDFRHNVLPFQYKPVPAAKTEQMYKAFLIVYISLVAFVVNAADRTPSPFSFRNKYKGEKLLIAGCGWNKIAVVDKQTGQLDWEHLLGKGEDCNDVELTNQRNILYAYTSGARLISPDQLVIWDYKTGKNEELFTATQLPSGGYLLAICGHPARIVELDKKGIPVKEFSFETGIESVHNQFRQILRTRRHTYLIPLFGTGCLIEIDQTGKLLNRVSTGGTPFSVKLLKSGNYLVACGDGHNWVEVDPVSWQIVHSVSSADIKGLSLLFVSELCRYKDGTTLVSNWNGHSADKSQPKLAEVDKDNQVVWRLRDTGAISNVSSVFLLP